MTSSAETAEPQRTALYEQHLQANGRMVEFAGYALPVQYSGLIDEHRAVRHRAGLFDVSHMGELEVTGAEALAFLQELLSNDLSKLRDGRAQYNLLLDDSGGILDDLLVYRRGDDDFLLVVNAAHRVLDREWIEERARGRSGVSVEDRSDDIALLALQGPKSPSILQPLTDTELDGLRYYSFVDGSVAGRQATISRTGYTGEDGFEIYLSNESASAVWDALLDEGGDDLLPAGLGARDTLRLEAGMLLSGQDFGRHTTPLEIGLSWPVKLGKGDFVGRDALVGQKKAGLRRRLVAFGLEGRGIARPEYPVSLELDGRSIEGRVTSGTWSPTLERAIGLALLRGEEELAEVAVGSTLIVEIRGRPVSGQVEELPFYRRA